MHISKLRHLLNPSADLTFKIIRHFPNQLPYRIRIALFCLRIHARHHIFIIMPKPPHFPLQPFQTFNIRILLLHHDALHRNLLPLQLFLSSDHKQRHKADADQNADAVRFAPLRLIDM